jgi:apolipoprotein N-acyltransferase
MRRKSPISIKKIIPAIISGVLLVLSFPPYGHGWLAFFALIPLISTLRGQRGWRAFLSGLILGMVYFFGTQYWIYHSINNYGNLHIVLSVAAVLLLALYQSIYTGIFAWLLSKTIRNTSMPALLLAPVLWVIMEYLRGSMLTGFPWSSIGYTQHEFLKLIQIADITGMYGVSFIVLAVNGAMADIFISYRRREDMPLFTLAPTAVGYVLLVIGIISTLLYGSYRINEQRSGTALSASIVQGNIDQNEKWDAKYQSDVLNTYLTLSAQAKDKNNPDLIIWPETSVPFYFNYHEKQKEELVEKLAKLQVPFLVGAIEFYEEENNVPQYGNTATLIMPDKSIPYIYEKIHLVPFGEYVPLKNMLFFIEKLVEGTGDYRAGGSIKHGEIKEGRFSTLICYEIIFPHLVRKFFRDGGDFMVTITNDAWFGYTPGPQQHFDMAVFRAIENRKPVIRAANTGVSGFIDSNGKVLSSTALFNTTVLHDTVFTDNTLTFYTKFGDLFVYLCTIITVMLLLNFRRK